MDFYKTVKIPVFGVEADETTAFTNPYNKSDKITASAYSDANWLNGESGTNVLLKHGFIEGIVRSIDFNTVLRQCTTMAATLANILAYRNSEARSGLGTYLYGDSVETPIGSDVLTNENDMKGHISALTGIFDKPNFLFNSEVTTPKIADLAVTTNKIAVQNVTTDRIADQNITVEKFSDDGLVDTSTRSVSTDDSYGDYLKFTLGQIKTAIPNKAKLNSITLSISGSRVYQATNANVSDRAKAIDTSSFSGSSKIYLVGNNAEQNSAGVAGNQQTLFKSSNIYFTSDTVNSPYFNTSSDERLKDNIHDIGKNQVKAIVEGVDVKTFNFKATPEDTTVGVIAQDILKQNTVVGSALVRKDEDGFYSLHESKLVYILWDYVKQLEGRVKDLENKLNEL